MRVGYIPKEPIYGINVILWLEGMVLAGAVSTRLDTNSEFIEVCSPESGIAKEYIPSGFSWEMQQSHLFMDVMEKDRMIDMQYAGRKFRCRFYTDDLEMVREGYVYIQRMTYEGRVGELAKFDVQFQPTGVLSRVEPIKIDMRYPGEDTDDMVLLCGWEIQGVAKRHRFVRGRLSSITIRRIVVKSKSRLTVSTTGFPNVVILCNANNIGELSASITGGDMISYYANHEIDCADVSKLNMWSMLLEAGTYYLVDDSSYSVSMLSSLPQTV